MHHSVSGVYSTLVRLSPPLERRKSDPATQDNALLWQRRQFDFGAAFAREEKRGVRSRRICLVGMTFNVVQSLGSTRNSKRKCSSGPVIGCRPETSMMCLDDRAADIQPDSHSIVLGCIESLEEFVRGFRCEADSGIFHAKAHRSPSSRSVLMSNSLGRSSTEPIASEALRTRFRMTCCSWTRSPVDGRKIVRELRSQDHAIPLKIAQRQCDHLSGCLIQIQRLQREFLLADTGRAIA